MSERGSFVTSYIYCNKCLNACESVLLGDNKFLKGIKIPMWTGCNQNEYLPIIAGKIGGSYAGEELHYFENELIPMIQGLMCDKCELKISVIPDNANPYTFIFNNDSILNADFN